MKQRIWTARTGAWLAALVLAGCAEPAATSPPTARVSAGDVPAITVDGVFDDWPDEALLLADADFLYARFLVEPGDEAIQASDRTLAVLFDLDADAGTGRARTVDDLAMGVDLEIAFSPREEGEVRRGVEVVWYDARGAARQGRHDDAGLIATPTYASRWYELRVSRHAPALRAMPAGGGEVRGAVGIVGPSGELEGWSAVSMAAAPPKRAAAPVSEVAVPAKPEGAVRVVSWNVLRGKPREMTGPFARVLDALDADVVLVQEWTVDDARYLRGWFNALVPVEGGAWEALTGEAWGVGVVSQHPIEETGPGSIYTSGSERPVRLVAGVVRTPAGPMGVASVHLKCCGGADSAEDLERMAEAGAINAALRTAWGPEVGMRVVAGDINLVGTRGPLDALRLGLGAEGEDLGVVRAEVLGDGAVYTWWEAGNAFGPGRLDWALVGGAELVQAFVLDTSRLGPVALRGAGLEAGDTGASDHLPVVVDLRPMGE